MNEYVKLNNLIPHDSQIVKTDYNSNSIISTRIISKFLSKNNQRFAEIR